MSGTKERLSATVDVELIRYGNELVKSGRFESFSAWVNTALRERLERDEKLQAIGEFIRAYEAEHGEITEADIVAAEREMQARAIHVRPK